MASTARSVGRACASVVAFALALAPLGGARGEDGASFDATATSTATATAPADPEGAASALRSDADLPSLGEIVVIGRRTRAEVARDPTASATVIEAARFAGEAKGVAELVATAPGVAVNDYGGLGHLSTVSIRGASADGVLVLLDGIPLNSAFGGGVDLGSIPRAWIERIEVVRGVEGAPYGAGALGGVVNVVTRKAAGSGGALELGAGSFDTFTASGDRAFAVGRASVRAAASFETTGGAFPYRYARTPDDPAGPDWVDDVRRNDAATRAGGLVAVRAPLGAKTLDVVAQVTGAGRGLPGSPYHLTPWAWQEDGRALLAARLSGPGPAPGLVLAATASGRLDLLDGRVETGRFRQRGGAGALGAEARLAHRGGALRIELEGRGEALDAAALGERRERLDLAATLADDLRLGGRVRLSPAVRAERLGPFDGVSTKLGASLRLAGPLALRASGGQSFRAPSFAELYLRQGIVSPNPDLVPEKGLGGDAALVLDAGPLFASVGGHATLYRDLIAYHQVSFGQLRPFNSGRVLVQGLEVELATAPVRRLAGLAASGAYTLLATEVLRGARDVVGREVPHRARHRLYARLSAEPGPVGLHVELHRVSRQFADAPNRNRIPGASVWNAGASLLLSRAHRAALHLEVRNLLDDRTLQDALANPLPGRSVMVLLRAGSPTPQGAP